jgi:uncharacterized protein DUF5681
MANRNRYEVGYRKPPTASQFVKGQSGNPKGRPKGSQSLGGMLRKMSRQRVKVTVSGRSRSVSKLEAAFMQLTSKAASGDLKAIKEYTYLLRMFEDFEQTNIQPPSFVVNFV